MTEQQAPAKQSVEAKPAATIILLRDGGQGLEVLMLEKASGKHFAAGALVFPGGKVAPEDIAYAQSKDIADEPFAALKIAAVREMYEECAIMLARQPGGARVMDAAEVAQCQASHGEAEILEIVTSLSLELATDQLVRFAHWITPPYRPKRFDTHFFIAPAPAGQMEADVDGYEIVDANWRRPADLLEDVHEGRVKLVLPTMMNIIKLSRRSNVAEALEVADEEAVVPVTPKRVKTEDGEELHIPDEAGYGMTTIPAEFLRSA